MYDVNNTSSELKEGKVEMAILPLGSIEQHSLHLPLGTDWIMAREISRRVAEKLRAYLLPAMPFGTAQEHSGLSGTVWIRPITLFYFLKDISSSLSSQGIKKIALIISHGGNWIVKPAVREVNLENPEISLIWCLPHLLAREKLKKIFESSDLEVHAGEFETSCMMYLNRELVKGKGVDWLPQVTQEFLDYLEMKKISPSGVWGKPSLASFEKGRKGVEIMVKETVKYIQETFKKIEKLKARPGYGGKFSSNSKLT